MSCDCEEFLHNHTHTSVWLHATSGNASMTLALQVLGKKRPDGSALLSVSELRDGIVTFEDPDDAERYGNLLEAEGRLEVHQRTFHIICRCLAVDVGQQVAAEYSFAC